MARHKREDAQALRRQMIAELLVREPHLTQRDIPARLDQRGCINPETGGPWSPATVNADIKTIRSDAAARMAEDGDAWRAAELAKLDHVEAAAWKSQRLDIVLRSMERRAKVLGLDAPDRIDHTSKGESIARVEIVNAPQPPPE